MTLGPGGSYPAQRRRHHRQQRQSPAQAMQSPRTTQARSGGYAAGTFYNPAAPYMLYGKLIAPGSSSSGKPQKARKAIPPQKAG